ncbi:UNVERIFIED_CONTAM: hypothetical protein H355_005489 [Colinus virginianus]|nr:hypothetical protein H355_005489 [Colinus virginianus]
MPPGIATPDYAYTGRPLSEEAERGRPVKIHVHSEEEIEVCALRRAVRAEAIDEALHEFIVSRGGYPSPLNYCGFPKSCCTSVNEVICHGIPDMRCFVGDPVAACRPLEKGDLLNIDVTVYYRGMHGDLNETYVVGGETDEDSKRLLQGAYLCLAEAIKRTALFRFAIFLPCEVLFVRRKEQNATGLCATTYCYSRVDRNLPYCFSR